MGKIYDTLDAETQVWLSRQKVFFVATAPRAAEGHINCSPKGGDAFRVLNEREVAYQDLTGSGIETVAHLRENGRIVLMFCAFEGEPRIVRLHGSGQVLEPEDAGFAELERLFPENPGTRTIVKVTLKRVADSCGFAVPFYDYLGGRPTLDKWAGKKGKEGLDDYRHKNNQLSIDGLPGLKKT